MLLMVPLLLCLWQELIVIDGEKKEGGEKRLEQCSDLFL